MHEVSGQGIIFVQSMGAIVQRQLREGEQWIVDNGHLVAWSANYKVERIQAQGGLLSKMHTDEGLVCRYVKLRLKSLSETKLTFVLASPAPEPYTFRQGTRTTSSAGLIPNSRQGEVEHKQSMLKLYLVLRDDIYWLTVYSNCVYRNNDKMDTFTIIECTRKYLTIL